MGRIEIPKSLLAGLLGTSAVAVIGVAFLLGRESGRTAPVKNGPQLERQNSAVVPVPPAGAAISAPASTQGTPTPAQVPDAATEPGPASIPRAPVAVRPDDPARAQVAAYFQAIGNLQTGTNGDPETLAQQVVAGLGKGDTAGFEDMIQQAREARRRLSAVRPPPPCAAYHRESLASLDAGLDLMLAMKKALASAGQDSQVLDLADRANALKARTDALQSQEDALRQRYGLAKPPR